MNIEHNETLKMKMIPGSVLIMNCGGVVKTVSEGEEIELFMTNGKDTIITNIWIKNKTAFCTERTTIKKTPFPIYPYTGTYFQNTITNFREIHLIMNVCQVMSEPQESDVKRTLVGGSNPKSKSVSLGIFTEESIQRSIDAYRKKKSFSLFS